MERTYNEFIDNGLFVLAYYLKKNIEDISEEDIKNSAEIMAERLSTYLYYKDKNKKTYLATIAPITNNNTFLTQLTMPVNKDIFNNDELRYQYILDKLKIFTEVEINEENSINCSFCGKKKVKINYVVKTKSGQESFVINRSYMAGLCSNTFTNSMNNLKEIDICPHCLYLGFIGCLNVIKETGKHIVLMSDSDKYMYSNTNELQYKLAKDNINSTCNKYEKESFISLIINNYIKSNRLKDGNYIQQICFVNGKSVSYEEYILPEKKLKLLNTIKNSERISYLLTNKKMNLFEKILFDKIIAKSINNCFKNKIIDTEELNVLYNVIGGYEMGKIKKGIIEKLVNNLLNGYDEKLIDNKLKINTYKEFKKFIIEENKNLMIFTSIEEIEELLNVREWKTTLEYINIFKDIEINKRNIEG